MHMFLFAFRLSPRRITIGAAALVLIIGLSLFAVDALRGGERMTSVLPTGETVSEKGKLQKIRLKTNEERVAFAGTFGWEVSAEPAEVLEVIIPKEFDQVYLEYNALQKKQGFDLEGYAGKRCKRYSYTITNHPQAESEVRINLLIYKDRLIGGDVCSTAAEGFMHGFAAETQNPQPGATHSEPPV